MLFYIYGIYAQEDVKPIKSWSDHSLTITSLYFGVGGTNSRLLSVSLDRTLKIWEISTKLLLCSINMPTSLTSVIMDITEKAIFIGGIDGNIYHIHLYSLLKSDTNTEDIFKGHSQSITSLSTSLDGSLLISGSLDGTVKIWDILSKQVLRSFNKHKGSVTFVKIIKKSQRDILGINEKSLLQPLQIFSKFGAGEPTSFSCKLFGNRELSTKRKQDNNDTDNDDSRVKNYTRVFTEDTEDTVKINNLQAEVETLKKQNIRWEKVSNSIYRYCIENAILNPSTDG